MSGLSSRTTKKISFLWLPIIAVEPRVADPVSEEPDPTLSHPHHKKPSPVLSVQAIIHGTYISSSEHDVRTLSKSDILICGRHLRTSKESSNPKFWIRPILVYVCATCSELPSYIRTLIIRIEYS